MVDGGLPRDAEDHQELDEAAYLGLAEFRLSLRRFLAFSDAITSATGVTSRQYQAMLP